MSAGKDEDRRAYRWPLRSEADVTCFETGVMRGSKFLVKVFLVYQNIKDGENCVGQNESNKEKSRAE